MKWKGKVQESCQRPGEVRAKRNEVGKGYRVSPDKPRSVWTSPSESERVRSSGRLRSHRTWLGCERSGRKGKGKERERKGMKGMYVRVRGMKETRKERGGRERDRGIGENRSVPLHPPCLDTMREIDA